MNANGKAMLRARIQKNNYTLNKKNRNYECKGF